MGIEELVVKHRLEGGEIAVAHRRIALVLEGENFLVAAHRQTSLAVSPRALSLRQLAWRLHSITSSSQSRRSRLLERLGYFASSTLVIVAGPSPTMSRIASSSLAPSQCTCFPKWVTKVPAGMATVLLGSNLLPVPTHHVPFSTVMKRSLGWKCGRLKLPASHLLMTT